MNVAVDQGATLQARYQEFLGAHKNLRSITNAYNAYLEKIAGMAVLRGSVSDEYLNHLIRVEKEVSRLTIAYKIAAKAMLDEMMKYRRIKQ